MTLLLKISEAKPDPKLIKKAAKIIREGGIVIFPTETVYGIGANAFDQDACRRIYEIKGRPSDNPLMIHVSDMRMASKIGVLPRRYYATIKRLWPGSIAYVTDSTNALPRREVAMRMPANKVALALVRESGVPIAAPSANISTRPSSTKASHAIKYFYGKVDAIIDSGPSRKGIESTILDLRTFKLLRPGAFPAERISKEFGRKLVITDASRGIGESKIAIAPGMKYKHYSPRTPLLLYTGGIAKLPKILSLSLGIKYAFLGSSESCKVMKKAGITCISLGRKRDLGTVARNLFDGLLKSDDIGVDIIVTEPFNERGIGLGIMNRLRKASSGNHFSDRKGLENLIR